MTTTSPVTGSPGSPGGLIGPDGPVGLIGVGAMGAGIGRSLRRAGRALQVWARRPEAAAPLVEAGASTAASPAALGRACGVVVLSLADAAALQAVLEGEAGLFAGLAPGSTVIDTSTVGAAAARGFGARAASLGLRWLDAPVSGGQAGAEAGTLVAMVGGDAPVLADVQPVLAAFCARIVPVGPVGAGQAVKACNQVAVAGAVLGVAEALALAEAEGVPPALVREVLLGGSAKSLALERHGLRMAEGDFAPGFRAALMAKDLRLALGDAGGHGLPLAGAARVEALLAALIDAGQGGLDWSAIALALAGDRRAARL